MQFSRTPTGVLTQTATGTFSNLIGGAGITYFTAFTAGYSGTVTGVTVAVNAVGNAVNLKCAIYADNAGVPGSVLASATAPITPVVVGAHAFTFSGVSVVKGTQYWVASTSDSTSGTFSFVSTSSGAANGASATMSYAVFPQASPVVTTPARAVQMSWTYTATPANWQAVSEAQQDATTSYVYDSVPGHADFYGIAAIASTPLTTFAVTTRAYAIKSDAGTRTMAVQLKSGNALSPTTWSTTDKTASVVLTGSNLVATSNGNNQGIRGAQGLSAGKYYFEVTMGWLVGNDLIGIANSAAALNITAPLNACTVANSGAIVLNNVSTGVSLSGTGPAGTVIGIAVDLDSKRIWFRVAPSGNWNGNAAYTPGGTGGIDFTVIATGNLYPYASFNSFTYAYTGNFGPSGFTGAVPAGFSAGFGSAGSIVTSPTVVLTPSNWQWAWRHDTTDPATGAAWSAAAVNVAQVGPVVIA